MSSMIKGPTGYPARRAFSGLCLALVLGLAAHQLAHTVVNPHQMTAVAGTNPSRASTPSTSERLSAISNPDSVSLLPANFTAVTPTVLTVFTASPILIHLWRHWPPPLHPPQFPTTTP